MIGKKTLDVNPIPAAEVKEILEEFSEKNELSYEQNLTLAHVTNFQKLPLEDTEKLIKELESIVKTKYAIRIADLMPKDLADLRLIFAKEKFPMKKDEMEDVLKILNKYQVEE
ncbi:MULTISPECIES: RNA polymerase Rpb4 family protein [Methanobrevibacter]|jgi:DNA-directed RNA polymerase subunit F|uniref:RNA polymerase Rpb4 family protein n=1 Tax=Methanobrevibacter TaxID=2172 RepID=UPI002A12F2A9|nr:RNA polymerase Rpb4 family protein [Methanobacteriaceae archaeon]MDD4594702.1 RNA polymerase Rpb4 family protein [Methanobacteriaceae archaeon]